MQTMSCVVEAQLYQLSVVDAYTGFLTPIYEGQSYIFTNFIFLRRHIAAC